ncbi:MAG: 5'/3'-nucleotidase SurE [Clostridia bacterium]|nr:5'/3'-nucleotidase SurE [Clostridia bacterium]
MKILIVNDDGIEAEGIKHLVNWAKLKGEVSVFAPKVQQSGKSHSIEIHNTYEVKKVDLFDGVEAYSVDSTPADCVRIAVLGMKKKFDLVLSGINNGPNLGGDIHYSGTVGACFEGAKSGIKSIAISSAFNSFDNAVKNLDRVFNEIQSRKMLDFSDILNVNFPERGDEILITRMGEAIYSDDFEFLENDMVKPCLISLYKGTRNLELDTDATMTGHISITPIRVDLTNFSARDIITKNVG